MTAALSSLFVLTRTFVTPLGCKVTSRLEQRASTVEHITLETHIELQDERGRTWPLRRVK